MIKQNDYENWLSKKFEKYEKLKEQIKLEFNKTMDIIVKHNDKETNLTISALILALTNIYALALTDMESLEEELKK